MLPYVNALCEGMTGAYPAVQTILSKEEVR